MEIFNTIFSSSGLRCSFIGVIHLTLTSNCTPIIFNSMIKSELMCIRLSRSSYQSINLLNAAIKTRFIQGDTYKMAQKERNEMKYTRLTLSTPRLIAFKVITTAKSMS